MSSVNDKVVVGQSSLLVTAVGVTVSPNSYDLVSVTAASQTITLPLPTAVTVGSTITVASNNGGSTTVQCSGTPNVFIAKAGGAAGPNVSVTTGLAAVLVSTGSTWQVISLA